MTKFNLCRQQLSNFLSVIFLSDIIPYRDQQIQKFTLALQPEILFQSTYFEYDKKILLKSTCLTASFTCTGLSGNGICWALSL